MGYLRDGLSLRPRGRLDPSLSFREKHPLGESLSIRNINTEADMPQSGGDRVGLAAPVSARSNVSFQFSRCLRSHSKQVPSR